MGGRQRDGRKKIFLSIDDSSLQQSALQLDHEGKGLFFTHAWSLVSRETYPPAVFIAVGGTDRAALAGGQAAAHAGQEPCAGDSCPGADGMIPGPR